jgi:hypothetical protein
MMQKTARILIGVLVGLMVAWLVGWIMGRAGKPEAERALKATELRLMLTEARARLLEARVDIYTINFGNASRNFERAGQSIRSASAALEGTGAAAWMDQLRIAMARADEARALSNKLDQGANARAAEAVTAVDAALAGMSQP